MHFHDAEFLIFDLDYTLIDSSEGIVWCFNEARRRAGEPEVEPDKLKARIGLPIEDGFRLFGSRDPLSMRELFRKLAREGAMAERSFLLPGVAETLSALREKGYRLAVASTKSRPEIVAILKHLGVADSFAEFVGSDEVKDPKPAPDSLLLAMERLRAAPERTVYVGDHVVDVKAGRSAGVRVIAVLGGPCSEAEVREERPAAVLASIKDILPLFSGPGRDD